MVFLGVGFFEKGKRRRWTFSEKAEVRRVEKNPIKSKGKKVGAGNQIPSQVRREDRRGGWTSSIMPSSGVNGQPRRKRILKRGSGHG